MFKLILRGVTDAIIRRIIKKTNRGIRLLGLNGKNHIAGSSHHLIKRLGLLDRRMGLREKITKITAQHQPTGSPAHARSDFGTDAEAARSTMLHNRSTSSEFVDVEPIDNRIKRSEPRLEPVR